MEQTSLADLQNALHPAPVGIILMDAQGNIQWHNQTLERMLDISAEQLKGKSIAELPKEMASVLASPPETILLQRDDSQRWLHCHSQTTDDGKRVQFYLDITTEQRLRLERDRLEDDLKQLTTRDPVTGLPNRRALLQGLEPLISRSRRYGNPLSLIKLRAELNGLAPDQLQRYEEEAWLRVGQLLKEQMRWADIIGRFDGPEFLLILPETPAEATETLAAKICDLIKALELPGDAGESLKVTPYCSLTAWHKGDDANLMLQRLSDGVAAARAAGTSIAAAG